MIELYCFVHLQKLSKRRNGNSGKKKRKRSKKLISQNLLRIQVGGWWKNTFRKSLSERLLSSDGALGFWRRLSSWSSSDYENLDLELTDDVWKELYAAVEDEYSPTSNEVLFLLL